MKKYQIIILAFVIAVLLFFITNKTLLYDKYELNDVTIDIPRFSYLANENTGSLKLISVRNYNSLDNDINTILDGYDSCYDESVFYDSKNDISITKYKINKNSFFNEITIKYDKGNLCATEYVLDDDYLVMFDNIKVIDSYIYKNNKKKEFNKLINLVLDINLFNRVTKNEVSNYDDGYKIEVNYTYEEKGYSMMVYNSDRYLVVEIVDNNDAHRYAYYNGVNSSFLENYYKGKK